MTLKLSQGSATAIGNRARRAAGIGLLRGPRESGIVQYTVTKTRKESSADGSHQHIEGVCTTAGVHYTRREVVDSIGAGNLWASSAGGTTAVIKPMSYCPASACYASPYITTAPDHTTTNNLENLPPC